MSTRTARAIERAVRVASLSLMLMVPVFITGVAQATTAEEDMVWTGGLRNAYFEDRKILADDLITLEAPQRAENAAIVPISIKAGIPQTEQRYIRTIWLFVDKNPGPLVGTFRFTPESGRADLGLRLRVDAYSPVRAIAETNDGELHMSRQFVKASGGCSAPPSSDADAARKNFGKMKFLLRNEGGAENATAVEQRTLAQLMIRHPNRSGLQMDQVTHLYAPPDFVEQVKVRFEGKEIFSAETSFAISENPSFRFYFAPQYEGELTAEVTDTEGRHFSETYRVRPGTDGAAASD
ncbi:MAG: quinoprotein dehydrogenase-associated SoxYZ-like carrier [Woeseia sp.]